MSLILKLDKNRPETIGQVVAGAAQTLHLGTNTETAAFAPGDGTMLSFLMYNSQVEVLIQSMSVEECVHRDGPRDPQFSRGWYTVSISGNATAQLTPSPELIASTIRQEARRLGGEVVNEEHKCDGFSAN